MNERSASNPFAVIAGAQLAGGPFAEVVDALLREHPFVIVIMAGKHDVHAALDEQGFEDLS